VGARNMGFCPEKETFEMELFHYKGFFFRAEPHVPSLPRGEIADKYIA